MEDQGPHPRNAVIYGHGNEFMVRKYEKIGVGYAVPCFQTIADADLAHGRCLKQNELAACPRIG